MAGIQMMLHRCTGIRVDSHNKSNANAITLEILRQDEQMVSLVLFELPELVTDQLLSAFADAKTIERTRNELALRAKFKTAREELEKIEQRAGKYPNTRSTLAATDEVIEALWRTSDD